MQASQLSLNVPFHRPNIYGDPSWSVVRIHHRWEQVASNVIFIKKKHEWAIVKIVSNFCRWGLPSEKGSAPSLTEFGEG